MCAAIAAAPAIAAGPPGWVVFVVVALGTVVVGALAVSSSQTQSVPRSTTKARDRTIAKCPPQRPWSVRVHAQGTQIGGTSGSTIGAPPLVKTAPITVVEGTALAAATYGLLSRSQSRNLDIAYDRCVAFIESRPPAGFLGQRSFYGRSRDNNRFDVDSYGPTPNFVS